MTKRRVGRVIGLALGALLLLMMLGVAFAWTRLRASLPKQRGTQQVAGVTATVTVKRDAHGVPTVVAASRADAAAALGFLHAQERFFQWICCGVARPVNWPSSSAARRWRKTGGCACIDFAPARRARCRAGRRRSGK